MFKKVLFGCIVYSTTLFAGQGTVMGGDMHVNKTIDWAGHLAIAYSNSNIYEMSPKASKFKKHGKLTYLVKGFVSNFKSRKGYWGSIEYDGLINKSSMKRFMDDQYSLGASYTKVNYAQPAFSYTWNNKRYYVRGVFRCDAFVVSSLSRGSGYWSRLALNTFLTNPIITPKLIYNYLK